MALLKKVLKLKKNLINRFVKSGTIERAYFHEYGDYKMKHIKKIILLIIVAASQIGCGLDSDVCNSTGYSQLDSESGVLIEDTITGQSEVCDPFQDNVKLTSPNGKIYKTTSIASAIVNNELIRGVGFDDNYKNAVVDLFSDLVFDSSEPFYVMVTSKTQDSNFGETKTLSLYVVKNETAEVLATKNFELRKN